LNYSGWLTHISGHPSATSLAQDSESTSAKTNALPLDHATNYNVVNVQLSRTQDWRPPMVAYCRLGHSLPEDSAARKTQDGYSPLPIPSQLPAGISPRQIELRLQELSR